MRLVLVGLLLITGLFTCGEGSEAEVTTDSEASTATPTIPITQLPRLPNARMQALVDSVDHIDFLFYEHAFSMSLDEDKGIKYALAQIGEGEAQRAPGCKAIGRIFYQIGGRTAAEASLYFTPNCTYLEFVENGKTPVFANAMSEVGKDFLNDQFQQLVSDFQPIQ